jgi:hypothetical protein
MTCGMSNSPPLLLCQICQNDRRHTIRIAVLLSVPTAPLIVEVIADCRKRIVRRIDGSR